RLILSSLRATAADRGGGAASSSPVGGTDVERRACGGSTTVAGGGETVGAPSSPTPAILEGAPVVSTTASGRAGAPERETTWARRHCRTSGSARLMGGTRMQLRVRLFHPRHSGGLEPGAADGPGDACCGNDTRP